MNILGIETTCDETSLALVQDGQFILNETTVSQILKHREFGGVVPDLGAREHLKNLSEIGDKFLEEIKDYKIDAVAVATKVGLPPALQVGESYAQGLSKSLGVPLIKVHHGIAHLWGVFIDKSFEEKPEFPFLGLIVSGKHTHLVDMQSPTDYEILGETLDDAVGEAFDKVARMLGLPYPGGPEIERVALTGDNKSISFPIPLKDEDTLNFSFSGLKTAVRNYIEKEEKNYTDETKKFFTADVAASFQEAAYSAIVAKVHKAMKETKYKTLVLGGGVAASQRLTDLLFNELGLSGESFDLFVPHREYCTDNASMIAGYAFNLAEN